MKEHPKFDIKYGPVGKCIYCGSDGTPEKLTDEHIIPKALAGRAILLEASCMSCQKITSAIEYHCGRNIFGHLRISQGLPTSRRKKRPTAVPAEFQFGDRFETRQVGFDENPATTLFPIFPMPTLLTETPQYRGPDVLGYMPFYNATALEKLKATIAKENVGKVSFARPHVDPTMLVRMLAKIAHSAAVAFYGLDGFTPLLPTLILEDGTPWHALVGGSYEFQRDTDHFHRIISARAAWPGRHSLLFMKIRLFAQLGTANNCPPFYWVAVGWLAPEQELAVINHADTIDVL
jgi:hypothetical protein